MNNVLKIFPNGKTKAFTMSFDDGKIIDRKFVNIINKYNLKSTFNINSGLLGIDEGFGLRLDRDEITELYKNHEIASHSSLHPTLPRCSRENLILQLFEDRKNLENIFKKTIRGFAYPNKDEHNKHIKELLPKMGFTYARTGSTTSNFNMPHDHYEWEFTSKCRGKIVPLAKDFVSLQKPQYLYLFAICGHSMDFEKANSWDYFEEFCQIISGKEDIWYVTNIDFIDYLNAWDQLRFSATNTFVENPTTTTCWISANNKVYQVKSGETLTFDE